MYSNHGLQQGSVIGDYTIVRQLGSGAFADVYLAQHTVLKTYVAI